MSNSIFTAEYGRYKILFFSLLLICCSEPKTTKEKVISKINSPKTGKIDSTKTEKIVTSEARKTPENSNKKFSSLKAIHKIREIEEEYFENYNKGVSKYYGTEWYNYANNVYAQNDSSSLFQNYCSQLKQRGEVPDSMHCTIYAIRTLEAGFGNEFDRIKSYHREIWGNREFAGWSIAHILTEKYNWKAYLIISKDSKEYNRSMKYFNKDKKYHVWYQPNIKIEKVYDFDEDKNTIDSLLSDNIYGWGFSEQGWHTWVTKSDSLKECIWSGIPGKVFDPNSEKPLFFTTKFTEFYDYKSHIVVFPP
jgi:hypothetical protein